MQNTYHNIFNDFYEKWIWPFIKIERVERFLARQSNPWLKSDIGLGPLLWQPNHHHKTVVQSSKHFENRVIIVTPNFQQDQTALFIQTLLALRPTTSIYNHRIVTSMLFAKCLFSPPIIFHSKTGGHITSISRFNNTNEPTYQRRHMTTFCWFGVHGRDVLELWCGTNLFRCSSPDTCCSRYVQPPEPLRRAAPTRQIQDGYTEGSHLLEPSYVPSHRYGS